MNIRTIAAACALCASLLPLAANAAVSTFDLSTEGWTSFGGGTVAFGAAGGNPAGHAVLVNPSDGLTSYFVAPAAFLGNASSALGSTLTFDLKQNYFPDFTSPFDAEDVVLIGNGITLVYDLLVNPALNAWTSYVVPLDATGWRVNTLGGAAATQQQFFSVLSALGTLRIRSEYRNGEDTGFLDNVVFGPATVQVPVPAALPLMLVGALALGAVARRRPCQEALEGPR